jgi:hypothetical protein
MDEVYNAIWNMGTAAWLSLTAICVWLGGKLNGAFLSALFGALGGSISAYLLASRSERRNKLREELAATNNAIGMTNNIINAMLSLKGQHLVSIDERYREQFEGYFTSVVAPTQSPIPRELILHADFRVVSAPHTMIEQLQRTITDRVTRSLAAQMLIGNLTRSVQTFVHTLDQRTMLIQQMREIQPARQLLLYLGLPDANGNVDDTYPDVMTAMMAYINDCIYFSALMVEVLARHGKALRRAYGWRAPKVVELDMTDERITPLMPDRAHYPDFELQFRPPAKLGRFARIWAWGVRRFNAATTALQEANSGGR